MHVAWMLLYLLCFVLPFIYFYSQNVIIKDMHLLYFTFNIEIHMLTKKICLFKKPLYRIMWEKKYISVCIFLVFALKRMCDHYIFLRFCIMSFFYIVQSRPRQLRRRRAKELISKLIGRSWASSRRPVGAWSQLVEDPQLFLAFADFCCSRRAGLCVKDSWDCRSVRFRMSARIP